jgi:hypothetical protein
VATKSANQRHAQKLVRDTTSNLHSSSSNQHSSSSSTQQQ